MIIRHKKIWFGLSGLAVGISVVATVAFGLNLGIDFTGGSLLELTFTQTRPNSQAVVDALSALDLSAVAQPIGEQGMILRFKEVDEATHQSILQTLRNTFLLEAGQGAEVFEELRFESIGPTIGQELKTKTMWAIGIIAVAIILYITWAFRKVSQPVASWKYGLVAVIALFHDVMITVGVFALLGQFYNIEVNASFIAALLTILGYSVNDTIVVFDRTRENLLKNDNDDFEAVVEKSVKEVITRSINASLTVLLVLFAILLLGGATIREFALALIIGISAGSYSSLFLASPLLVALEKWRHRA